MSEQKHSIWQALIAAQATVAQAKHDRKMDYGQKYTYTSAEEIIRAAKDALNAHNLAVVAADVLAPDDKGFAEFQYLLVHESGETALARRAWAVVETKGRPMDKAMAAAATNCLSYYLRDLLLIERPGASDDMNARDDSRHEPRKSHPQPSGQGNGKSRPSPKTKSRSELIAKMSPEQIKEKVLAGAKQIMALETTEDEAAELVEVTQGDYTPAMLEGLWGLFDKVKARLKNTADLDLF